MKPAILLAAAALMASPAGAQPIPTNPPDYPVTFIPHQTIEDAMSRKRDALVLSQPNLAVEGDVRDKAGDIQFHDGVTDVFYITDGEATLVVGGKYEGGVRAAPDQVHGGKIIGGTSYHVVKGDAIVIPSRTAHWFMEVPKSVKYFTVRVWDHPAKAAAK